MHILNVRINFIFLYFLNFQKYTNGSFEYVQPRDQVFGALINGSWNGLTGMLCRNVGPLIVACLKNITNKEGNK